MQSILCERNFQFLYTSPALNFCKHVIIYPIGCLASRSGQNQILHCDWLRERARWSYLGRSGLPAVPHKKNFSKSHIINPLLTKFVRSRWLAIGDSFSVHKHEEKELGQYPAILTSITHIYCFLLFRLALKLYTAVSKKVAPVILDA